MVIVLSSNQGFSSKAILRNAFRETSLRIFVVLLVVRLIQKEKIKEENYNNN